MTPRNAARRIFLGGSLVLLAGLALGSSWGLAQEEGPAVPSDGAWTLFLGAGAPRCSGLAGVKMA